MQGLRNNDCVLKNLLNLYALVTKTDSEIPL